MQFQFRSNDSDGGHWQQHMMNTLRQALRSLRGRVARMMVRLDDVDGPAGGVDKRCSIHVLVQGVPLVDNATARTWQESVEAAASRLGQRVVLPLHRVTVIEHQAMPAVLVRARAETPVAGVRSLRLLYLNKTAPAAVHNHA